jgi:hypothetical protein
MCAKTGSRNSANKTNHRRETGGFPQKGDNTMKSNKQGAIYVRLDWDLADFVRNVLKERRGGVSKFVNDAIRNEKDKHRKGDSHE